MNLLQWLYIYISIYLIGQNSICKMNLLQCLYINNLGYSLKKKTEVTKFLQILSGANKDSWGYVLFIEVQTYLKYIAISTLLKYFVSFSFFS